MVWWLWLALGLVLLLAELATPSGFFVMFFGFGALTLAALSSLGLAGPSPLQWLIFTTLSVIYLLAFRGRMQRSAMALPGSVDTLIGEVATPRERILPGHIGRVDLRGSPWNARNETSQFVEAGQRCRVTRVEGLMVSVEPE